MKFFRLFFRLRRLRKQKTDQPVGRRRTVQVDQDSVRSRSPAFSYYSQRSQELGNTGRRDPDEVVASRKTASSLTRYHALFVYLACVGIAGGMYVLSLGFQPNVILLQDQATDYFLQDAGVYQQAAERSLGKSIFNHNKLTIDTARVRKDLLKNYPEIKNVSIVLPVFGHQPQVYVEPYKPSFILTTTSSNAFLLDTTGRALATTSQITDIDKLGVPTLQDNTGAPVKLGNRALPGTTISFARSVFAALKAKGVTVSAMVLPPAASELDVSIAETPYFVKFNLQNDPLQQAGTYLATKQRLAADHVMPGQYIDVRVPERAYYK